MQAKVSENTKVTRQSRSRRTTTTPTTRRSSSCPTRSTRATSWSRPRPRPRRSQQLLEADPSDANWKKVAKKYSTDPGSKDKGGSARHLPKGRMVAEFDKVAFSIKPGTISAPVKSQFGWHVIEVTKKTPGSSEDLRRSQGDDRAGAQVPGSAAKAWETWLDNAKKTAGIVYAAGFDPKTLTASPSPSGSAAPVEPGPVDDADGARSARATRQSPMSLTLVYIGAAAGLAPAASLRALAGGGAVFVPAGLDGELRRPGRGERRPRRRAPPRDRPGRRRGPRRPGRAAPWPARSSSRSPGRTGRAWRASCGARVRRPGARACRRPGARHRPRRAPPSTTLCSARSWCRSSASSTCCAWSARGTASRRRATSSATPSKRCTSWPTPSPPTTSRRSTASSATCCCRSCCSPSCSASRAPATWPASPHDIEAKLIRRHPHIFADAVAETPGEVKSRWERIKVEQEGREGIFHDVPASFPAILQARKLQQRAAQRRLRLGLGRRGASPRSPRSTASSPSCCRAAPRGGGGRRRRARPRPRPARPARRARGRRPAVRHRQRGAAAARRPGAGPARGFAALRAPGRRRPPHWRPPKAATGLG